MKRRFTILTAAFALLAILAIPMGMTGQTRTEEVYSTCLFGSDYNSQNVSSYTATWTATNGDFTWTIVNGNNNNNAWSYVKFGRKNNASVGKITTTEAYKQAITKVDLAIDAITAGSVNSIKLYASTDNDAWTEVGSFAKSTGLQTVTVENPAADQYYMIEFDCASGSANGLVTVSKVEYYYNTSGASSPTISADNVELAYDATSGAIEYTINNPVQGGELTAVTDAEWISIGTVGDDAVPFTCTVNEGFIRTATVALTYSYDNEIVTKSITVTQDANPNGPGSQDNPYTVAQAHAAIDAGTGTQGVYATGIVSAIPTEWSTQYNNITFNFVDNTGDTEFLQAYRCVSSTGVDASTVAVGDIVVVHGNLTKYGSTYEFGQGCELVSLEHPTTPSVTVTPSTINAPFAGAEGTLALTYENIEDFISFDYYFCDADGNELEDTDPDYPGNWIYAEINEENDAYTLSYIIDANDGATRTAYMKVYTYNDNVEEVYAIVTVNQAQYVVDYAELPFEYDGNGTGDLPNGFTVSGLGTYNSSPAMKFDGTGDYAILKFNERPGTLTFDIKGNTFSGGTFTVQTSEDGVTYTDLETYTELGDTQHELFDNLGENVRYIKWIYTEKVSGNVALGNIALAEYVAPVLVASITVNPDVVELDAEEHDGTLDLTYENLTITEMSDFDIQFCDANGDELSEEPDWIEVLVAGQDPEIGEGYVVSYYMVENEGTDARTAYFKVYAMDDETNLVYSNLVTISQAAPVAPVTGDKYVKVTSTADLTSGQYLIVYAEGSVAFDGSLETLDAASNTIEVTINDDEIGITNITTASEFTIDVTAGTIMSASGYYIGQTSDANGLASSTTTAYTNTISFDEDGNANIVSEGAYLRYNSASNQTRFRYYKSSSYTNQKAIQLYKKVGAEPATETYTLTINGYQNDENDGGYYLIASPVNVDPATVDMTTGDFDLYYFDEGQELEWRNYEATSFNLVPGKGYLYAKKATTEGETFSFELTGTPYSGNGTIDLTYTENAEFAGFNLIGNPFGTNANLDLPYYRLNSDGSALNTTTESSEINVMEGVFVQATAANPKANFTKVGESAKKIGQLNVKVTRNRSVILDNAIIRFDEGATLSKFQLNANSTKLYFTEGNQDFAVVRSANEGEMPVNFKAAENGNYTLSIETENVEMSYLHLIDNMTGADVDLLASPSYSFEARTNDYASRFRLVFNANDNTSTSSEAFAFFNGNNLVINNEGEATLQVIDMMGRMISSEQINGSYNNSLNLSAGVYVLRLSNGNTVKTQKIVID
jgi:hypothetical protein